MGRARAGRPVHRGRFLRYAGFLADLGIVGAFVDFRIEHVAVFGYGGTASRGCDPACVEPAASTVWVLAFPAAADPATCLVVDGGCAQVP